MCIECTSCIKWHHQRLRDDKGRSDGHTSVFSGFLQSVEYTIPDYKIWLVEFVFAI